MKLADATNAAFGDLPAVGHVLRRAMSHRWLRVHSLPNSKRYAETEAEYAELLRRHNELALEILGPRGQVVLYLHAFGDVEDFPRTFSGFGWAAPLNLNGTRATVYPSPEADDPDLVVASFSILWSPQAWDPLLRDVADDRLPSVVLLNPATGEAYAPYDGGADLFLTNSERVTALAKRWASWLSMRSDRL